MDSIGSARGATERRDAFDGLIVVENWFEELTDRVPVP
jgi:hypothetical protein